MGSKRRCRICTRWRTSSENKADSAQWRMPAACSSRARAVFAPPEAARSRWRHCCHVASVRKASRSRGASGPTSEVAGRRHTSDSAGYFSAGLHRKISQRAREAEIVPGLARLLRGEPTSRLRPCRCPAGRRSGAGGRIWCLSGPSARTRPPGRRGLPARRVDSCGRPTSPLRQEPGHARRCGPGRRPRGPPALARARRAQAAGAEASGDECD